MSDQPQEPFPVSITLELQQRDGELWGVLTFSTTEPYELEFYNVHATGASYFQLLQGEQRLPYVGPRRKMDGERMQALQPGEPHVREVQLDNRYRFSPGSHSYTVQYRALHLPPDEDAELVPLRSNVVQLEYDT